uniref:Uncharacterized protein n=1 Tax=Fagus sylvatica TaxID=28930 RepID=A0A2N9GU91_FAGSY
MGLGLGFVAAVLVLKMGLGLGFVAAGAAKELVVVVLWRLGFGDGLWVCSVGLAVGLFCGFGRGFVGLFCGFGRGFVGCGRGGGFDFVCGGSIHSVHADKIKFLEQIYLHGSLSHNRGAPYRGQTLHWTPGRGLEDQLYSEIDLYQLTHVPTSRPLSSSKTITAMGDGLKI